MPTLPGLRSPYAKVGRLVYFGRMVDKLRLQAAGKLTPDYTANVGKGFDGRCCSFLRINHEDLRTRVLAGGTDEEILEWAHTKGGAHTDEECEIWSGFMSKRGWRDAGAETLAKRIKESALEGAPVMTMFDYLDYDEGRENAADRPWEKI